MVKYVIRSRLHLSSWTYNMADGSKNYIGVTSNEVPFVSVVKKNNHKHVSKILYGGRKLKKSESDIDKSPDKPERKLIKHANALLKERSVQAKKTHLKVARNEIRTNNQKAKRMTEELRAKLTQKRKQQTDEVRANRMQKRKPRTEEIREKWRDKHESWSNLQKTKRTKEDARANHRRKTYGRKMIAVAKLGKKTLGEASTCNLGPISQTSEVKLSASLNATLPILGTIDCSTFQESRMMNYDMDCGKTVKFNSFGLEHKVASSVFDIYGGGRPKKADSDSDFLPDKSIKKASSEEMLNEEEAKIELTRRKQKRRK